MARVPEDPVDGGHGGDRVGVTDALREELLPDFPCEERGVFRLDAEDPLHHRRSGHLLLHGGWKRTNGHLHNDRVRFVK